MRSAAILLAAGLLAAPAAAADLPPAQIAVLDYQAVIRDSVAAQEVRRQIDEYRRTYQEEMAREEEQLRNEEQELKKLRGTIPAAAFDERRRSFERRVQEAQRRAQDQARSLDRVFNQAMGQVRRQMAPIVADLTKELGFNLVVDKGQILFAARALDISQEVAAALNERLPHLEVARPER
jgi:outer membrane protein